MSIDIIFYWENPTPISSQADNTLEIRVPFGNIIGSGSTSGVTSVNGETGNVVLNFEDVGADEEGSSEDVRVNLQSQLDTLPTFTDLEQFATLSEVSNGDATTLLGAQSYTNSSIETLSDSVDLQLVNKADLVDGVLKTSQIPAIAITEFLGSVSNQSEMLLLQGQSGDWCIRTDVGLTYIITSPTNTGLLTDWTSLATPNVPVTSVNGQVGDIVLSYSDVNADQAGSAAAVQSNLQSQINTKADASSVISSLALKVDKTITISSGTGLSGGGDLSTNRTLSIANTGVTAGSYGTATKVPHITINAQGQVTAATEVDITASGGVIITWTNATLSAGYASGLLEDSSNPLQIGKSSDGYIYIRGVIRNTSGSTNNNVFLVLPSTHYLKGYTNTSFTQFTLAAPRMQAMNSSAGPYNVFFFIISTVQQLSPVNTLTNTTVWQIPQAILGIALNP